MIFLSDGECAVSDAAIQDLCLSAVRLGYATLFLCKYTTDLSRRKSLSFHSISFGPDASASSLRRMADLALGIQNNNPQMPPSVPSSFSVALNTVRNTLHLS